MNIITISREFGSGGRELGKLLAEALGWDYYDREIISEIAKNKGMDETYVDNLLNNYSWQNTSHSHHSSFSVYSLNISKVELLLEQKKVVEGIADLGKDCIIVGRNADVLLEKYKPLNIFVCASFESKLARCMKYAQKHDGSTQKQVSKMIKTIDKHRIKTREILTNTTWGDPHNYHLTVNTSVWEKDELVKLIKEFAVSFFRGRE